ncbi:DUF2218 domain-containing protein [Streptomyces sp. NBC_00377]|uniref:DUF2218 domain-containing protein n=1 Tax=unclassified Streptomyces TaxID=2593676 RepID=UPI002E1C2741|nr:MULTISPECIES: DUF2218 domain-containing protein [unclassified Streptomyces]
MPTDEARVETDRASRYLGQLCRHVQQMGDHPHYGRDGGVHRPPQVHDVEWSDTEGTAHLSLGLWTLQATPDALVLRIEADTEEDLQRMRDLIADRIETIGRRDQLAVAWQQPAAPGDPSGAAVQPHRPHLMAHGHAGSATRRWGVKALVGAGALLVVAHLALGGSVLAASRWWGWGAGAVVVAVVLVKVVGMGGLLAHRRRRRAL